MPRPITCAMSRAVKIIGRGTEMYFVLYSSMDGIIQPGIGQGRKKRRNYTTTTTQKNKTKTLFKHKSANTGQSYSVYLKRTNALEKPNYSIIVYGKQLSCPFIETINEIHPKNYIQFSRICNSKYSPRYRNFQV